MIDLKARDAAADLLERFSSGVISNDELEDGWPSSPIDPALDQIEHHIWGTYDGMSEQRLEASSLDAGRKELYERTVVFLRSSQEYEWPDFPSSLGATLLAAVTRGLSRVFSIRPRRRFRAAGNLDVWPFIREEDFIKREPGSHR